MPPKILFDTSIIDWRKPNTLIAREVGVSRDTVVRWRRKAKAQKPLFGGKPEEARRRGAILDRASEIRGKSRAEAERILGFRFNTRFLYTFARTHARVGPPRRPWHLLNFDLPSGVLANIWRIPIQAVHNERRRNKHGEPKWTATRNFTLKANSQFSSALRAEEKKAQRYSMKTGS